MRRANSLHDEGLSNRDRAEPRSSAGVSTEAPGAKAEAETDKRLDARAPRAARRARPQAEAVAGRNRSEDRSRQGALGAECAETWAKKPRPHHGAEAHPLRSAPRRPERRGHECDHRPCQGQAGAAAAPPRNQGRPRERRPGLPRRNAKREGGSPNWYWPVRADADTFRAGISRESRLRGRSPQAEIASRSRPPRGGPHT